VRRQEWSYDALGRLATAVQYDATTAGNATDGIKYSYDAWGFRDDLVILSSSRRLL